MNNATDDTIRDAVIHCNFTWPKQLTSGVMFFKGQRITRAEFKRIANQLARGEK